MSAAAPTVEAPEETGEADINPRQLPLFEGKRVTSNRVSFSGDNPLDDLELAKAKLGTEVELVVRARIASKKYAQKRDDAGNVIDTIQQFGLAVVSITAYDPE